MEMSRTNRHNSILDLAVMSKNAVMFDVAIACVEQDLTSPEVSIVTKLAMSILSIFRKLLPITCIPCLLRNVFMVVWPRCRTTTDWTHGISLTSHGVLLSCFLRQPTDTFVYQNVLNFPCDCGWRQWGISFVTMWLGGDTTYESGYRWLFFAYHRGVQRR